jgi:hypothetical protein
MDPSENNRDVEHGGSTAGLLRPCQPFEEIPDALVLRKGAVRFKSSAANERRAGHEPGPCSGTKVAARQYFRWRFTLPKQNLFAQYNVVLRTIMELCRLQSDSIGQHDVVSIQQGNVLS